MMLDALFQPVSARINEPQSLISTSIPCQYWYENAWYNLVPLDGTKPGAYKSSGGGSTAYYQFCQQMNTNSTGIPASCANDLNKYADVVSPNSTCSPLSTDSKESITMMPDGYKNTASPAGTNSTLGI